MDGRGRAILRAPADGDRIWIQALLSDLEEGRLVLSNALASPLPRFCSEERATASPGPGVDPR